MKEEKERSQSFCGVIESENTAEACMTNAIGKWEKNPVTKTKHVTEFLPDEFIIWAKKEGR